MAENQPSSPVAGQPPVENTPAHDNQRAENSVSPNLSQKIRRAAAECFEWGGKVWKRGGGRPRADGSPGARDFQVDLLDTGGGDPLLPGGDPASMAAAALPAPIAAPAPNDFALFRRSIVSGAKGALKIAADFLALKAGQAGFSPEFCEKLKTESRPAESDLQDFSESLEIVLAKYNVSSEHAPEIALAINTAKISAPLWLSFAAINAEIKRRKATETAAAKTVTEEKAVV